MTGTQRQHITHINFDELLALAKDEPAIFEARRAEYIESFLTSMPVEKQTRLRGLQWQIDQKRYLARTPMAACIAISDMMWDSLQLLGDQQRELINLSTGQSSLFVKVAPASSKSTVIPFPRP